MTAYHQEEVRSLYQVTHCNLVDCHVNLSHAARQRALKTQKLKVRWSDLYPLLCEHRQRLDTTYFVVCGNHRTVGYINALNPRLLDAPYEEDGLPLDLSYNDRHEIFAAYDRECCCDKRTCLDCTGWLYVPVVDPSQPLAATDCSVVWLAQSLRQRYRSSLPPCKRADFEGEKVLLWFSCSLFGGHRDFVRVEEVLFRKRLARYVKNRGDAVRLIRRNAGLSAMALRVFIEFKNEDHGLLFGDCYQEVLQRCFHLGLKRMLRVAPDDYQADFDDCDTFAECVSADNLRQCVLSANSDS